MRSLILLAVIISCTVLALVWSERPDLNVMERTAIGMRSVPAIVTRQHDASDGTSSLRSTTDVLLDIEPYVDLDYGFSVAVPAGWRMIVTADASAVVESDLQGHALEEERSVRPETSDTLDMQSGERPQILEPGYAVGFESLQQDVQDRFADYILIEILPGTESGLFEPDGRHRQPVTIDGRRTWYDRLEVDHAVSAQTDVDLVIYQAGFSGLGYTVGLYAIGEPARERVMAAAFEVLLQTFTITHQPFKVS